MKPHIRTLFMIFAAAIALGLLGACSYWSMTPEEKARRFTNEVSEELELSNAQRLKLETLVDTFMKSRQLFYRERQSERETVLEMVQADTFDQRRALEMIRNKTRIIDQQTPHVVKAYADLHNSLSAEQRKRISQSLFEMFDHYDKKRKGQ